MFLKLFNFFNLNFELLLEFFLIIHREFYEMTSGHFEEPWCALEIIVKKTIANIM